MLRVSSVLSGDSPIENISLVYLADWPADGLNVPTHKLIVARHADGRFAPFLVGQALWASGRSKVVEELLRRELPYRMLRNGTQQEVINQFTASWLRSFYSEITGRAA
jgi:hypothetical protein